jgi:hypothetical protein
MKKSIFIMSIIALTMLGCSKSEEANLDEQDLVWVLNQKDQNLVWNSIEIDNSDNNETINDDFSRGNSSHTHGNYTGFGGGITIVFSGTENNGGAHGSAEILQEAGPFTAHYLMETTSVVVNDNYAIYGGTITEVLVNTFPPPPPPPPGVPAPPCNPNEVGNYVYFTVYDNGQGNNAPADQYRGLFQSCTESLDGAETFPWFIFGQPSDVMNPSDKIKVNN